MSYKLLQLTNTEVGAVATDELLPLGSITRRISCGCDCNGTFTVSTTGSNTITLNDVGYYRITYTASLVAGAVGLVSATLLQNGIEVLTVSETATAVGDTANITLDYIVRVFPSCASVVNAPVVLQIENTGVAITDGTSNIVVEKVY